MAPELRTRLLIGRLDGMSFLVSTHEVCLLHETGPGHPERPERLSTALLALREPELAEAVRIVQSPPASESDLLAVHPSGLLNRLKDLSASGGGAIDPDTTVGPESDEAARRAAGAGLDLIDRLEAGEADIGWSLVRPPGHHARPDQQMGFCLINNVAVAAMKLKSLGYTVAIVDVDAHHGNGTQDIFYADPDVLFVSLHQYPFYPGTGSPDEVGEASGVGRNVNIGMPAYADGLAYRAAVDRVVLPVLDRFGADWILISAGFDGHRDDPLTDLGLSSADYAEIVAHLVEMSRRGRCLLFLEGGYNLEALSNCVRSVTGALLGLDLRSELVTGDGPGLDEVEVSRRIHLDSGEGDW